MPSECIILPYAVSEKENGEIEDFSSSMTVASILIEIENDRKKGGGLFSKEGEKIEFVASIRYPLVLTPWKDNRHIIFDAMGIWHHSFNHQLVPDCSLFTEEISKASGDVDHYLTSLGRNEKIFSNFIGTNPIRIEGLFIHEELMSDLLSHISLGKPGDEKTEKTLPMGGSLDDYKKRVNEMLTLIEDLNKDISRLSETINHITGLGKKQYNEIDRVTTEISRDFENRIGAIRPGVMKTISELESGKDLETSPLIHQRNMLEIEKESLDNEIIKALDFVRTIIGDEQQKEQARMEVDEKKSQLRELESQIEDLEDGIRQISRQYNNQIEAEAEKIKSLERERDIKVAVWNQKDKAIRNIEHTLITDINQMKEKIEGNIKFIESQGVHVPAHIQTTKLYLPIWICKLTGPKKSRILVFPPMISKKKKGILGGLKSMVGGMVIPLEPKTKQFDKIFKKGLEEALETNKQFAGNVEKIGIQSNIMKSSAIPGMFSKGVQELVNEGWIKEKHQKVLIESFKGHFG